MTDSVFAFNELLVCSPRRAVQTFILSLNYVQDTVEMQLSQDDPLDTSSRKAANVPSSFMGLLLLLTLTLEAKENYMIKKRKLHDLTNDIVTP